MIYNLFYFEIASSLFHPDRQLVNACLKKTLQPSTAMSLTLVLPNHSVGTSQWMIKCPKAGAKILIFRQ